MRTAGIILGVLGLTACAGEEVSDTAASPCDTALEVTWAGWGDGFFGTYCRACHSVDAPYRFDAPEGVDFDTLADVRRWEDPIEYTVFDDQSMPVGGGIMDEDLVRLQVFLSCAL